LDVSQTDTIELGGFGGGFCDVSLILWLVNSSLNRALARLRDKTGPRGAQSGVAGDSSSLEQHNTHCRRQWNIWRLSHKNLTRAISANGWY
jgi:hypothetical protein